MKVLQLRSTSVVPFHLDLHPNLTVVRGLSGAPRLQLVDTFEAIAAGRPVAMEGLLEAHGVRLDLDVAALRVVLGLGGTVFSPVIRSGDVPTRDEVEADDGRTTAVAARAELAEALTDVERRLREAAHRRDDLADRVRRNLALLVEPPPPDTALDLERQEADAVVAVAEREVRTADLAFGEAAQAVDAHRTDITGSERLTAARKRHARAADALARASAALEGARMGVDRAAPEALRVALARLRTLQAEHAADPAVGEWSAPGGGVSEDAGNARPTRELPDRADASPAEQAEVRAALVGAEAVAASTPSEAALRLADRWSRARAQQTAAGATGEGAGGGAPAPNELGAARARVERAAETLAALEFDAEPVALDSGEVAEVKAAHAALLQARERAEKRFGAVRAGRREVAVEQAAQRERELLARLGFASYPEFAISASGPHRSGAEGRIETARVHLDQARRELAAMTARLEGQPAPVATESPVLARLRSDAVALLGFDPGPDVDQVLRKPSPDLIPDFVRLMAALDAVGVSTGGTNLDLRGWCDLAREWLEGPTSTGRRADGAVTERSEDAAAHRARMNEVDRTRQRATNRARRLQDARAQLPSLQMRAVVHGDAVARVADLELALASLKAHERIAAAEVHTLDVDFQRRDEKLSRAVDAAQETLVRARLRLQQAVGARAALGEPTTPEGISVELIETQRQLMAAAADVGELEKRRAALQADLAELDRQVESGPSSEATELDRRRSRKAAHASELEALEWYVLGRLAGQRSGSIAGALPLLLDEPFPDLPKGMVRELLDWLERMAAAVQVVILTEDVEAAAWVSGLGPDRGVLVHADQAGI